MHGETVKLMGITPVQCFRGTVFKFRPTRHVLFENIRHFLQSLQELVAVVLQNALDIDLVMSQALPFT